MKYMALLLIGIFSCNAQQRFAKGYFIDRSGQRTECEIQTANFDFMNDSGGVLSYRLDKDAEYSTKSFSLIETFFIEGVGKYIRFDIALDDSELADKLLGVTGTPEFNHVDALLYVKVEGQASLYVYPSRKGDKYFFRVKGDTLPIRQLYFKRWKPNPNNIKEMPMFRQQLLKEVNCGEHKEAFFGSIPYQLEALRTVFEEYNACKGDASVSYKDDPKRKVAIGVTVFAGVRQTKLAYINGTAPGEIDGNPLAFGAEAEFLFFPGKWALFLRPEYVSFSGSYSGKGMQGNQIYDSKADPVSVNIPIGVRRYFGLAAEHRVFVDFAVGMSSLSGHVVTTADIGGAPIKVYNEPFKNVPFFSLGAGYVFNKRIGVDFIYNSRKNIFPQIASGKEEALYSEFGMNFRYTFF